MKALIGAVALSFAAPTLASEVPEWQAVDADTGQIRDIAGLEQLARDFPDSGTVRLRALQPYLQAEEMEKVMETLKWLYDRGYVFSEVSQQQISNLMEGVDPGRIAERLRSEAEVIETSQAIDFVVADAQLIESVLRDPIDDRLIVTSVIDKAVFAHKWAKSWEGYRPKGAANLSGIALSWDAAVIWFGSGHIDGSDDTDGFAGLIGLTREGTREIRIAAPNDVSISDIVAADDGMIYGSDPIEGGVYFASPEDEQMQALVPPGTFRSPQGLAVSADGTKLYVSDYRYGIAVVDLRTSKVSRLSTDLPLILDGIDGMWRYGNELIAVQNGTSPMRIAAFELSEDGMSVIGHRILEQAHSEWTEPLSGNLDGDSLLYIGNGQWDRFVKGEPVQDKPALPTQIRRLPIR